MINSALSFVVLIALCPAISGQYSTRRPTAPSTSPNLGARKGVIVTFHGSLKKMTNKEILIQSDDHQLLTFRRNRETKFTKDNQEIKAYAIDLETPLTIDVKQDIDLKLIAVNVMVTR